MHPRNLLCLFLLPFLLPLLLRLPSSLVARYREFDLIIIMHRFRKKEKGKNPRISEKLTNKKKSLFCIILKVSVRIILNFQLRREHTNKE